MTMMMKGSAGLDLYTNSLSRHAMSQFSPNFLCLRQAILQLSVRLLGSIPDCGRNVLKVNEPILTEIGTIGPRGKDV